MVLLLAQPLAGAGACHQALEGAGHQGRQLACQAGAAHVVLLALALQACRGPWRVAEASPDVAPLPAQACQAAPLAALLLLLLLTGAQRQEQLRASAAPRAARSVACQACLAAAAACCQVGRPLGSHLLLLAGAAPRLGQLLAPSAWERLAAPSQGAAQAAAWGPVGHPASSAAFGPPAAAAAPVARRPRREAPPVAQQQTGHWNMPRTALLSAAGLQCSGAAVCRT